MREVWRTAPLRVRVAAGGRIVIPAEVRQALGIKEGDEVLLSREDDGIRITTYQRAIRRAREVVAQYVEPGVSLAAELSQERQREAAEEEHESRKPSPR